MMTTPERLRRRQLIEGGILILLGVFIAVQSLYFSLEDRDQRKCFEENFSKLSYALEARSRLTERETNQNKKLWLIYAKAAGIVKASGKPAEEALTEKQKKELNNALVKQLLSYQSEIRKIEQDRRENPLPPYPVGVCEDEQ